MRWLSKILARRRASKVWQQIRKHGIPEQFIEDLMALTYPNRSKALVYDPNQTIQLPFGPVRADEEIKWL